MLQLNNQLCFALYFLRRWPATKVYKPEATATIYPVPFCSRAGERRHRSRDRERLSLTPAR
jgi:hypothetical protein